MGTGGETGVRQAKVMVQQLQLMLQQRGGELGGQLMLQQLQQRVMDNLSIPVCLQVFHIIYELQ